MRTGIGLVLLLLVSAAVECNSSSPPGKPVLLGCRSPEKETFTCWWEPGSDGGLPTTHRLYYEREKLEGTFECPDYRSAGKNSCFFDKNQTSIWVDYYLTVVASNALGNATSDTLKIDVMEIVKPDAPENVTLQVEEREHSPYVHVRWERPNNTDTRSGWVTVKYELRVQQEHSYKWKEYTSGTQTHFSLHNLIPGSGYLVQVRCRLDHGTWSEWSNAVYVKIPHYFGDGKLFWTIVSCLAALPITTALCILIIKRESVKKFVLPPVPVPKIRGVEFQLLKRGPSEDVNNALITQQSFPLMVAWKDQIEDYLMVTDNDDGLPLDPSNSQKTNLIIPAGFNFESEIQCQESKHLRNTPEESFSKQVNDGNAVNTFTNGDYVDIQRPEGKVQQVDVKQVNYSRVKDINHDNVLILEKENILMDLQKQGNIAEDYSKVKDMNGDNVVLLQNLLVGTSCREKSNSYTDFPPHKANPHQVGAKPEVINSGYVDVFVPAQPLM